MKQNAYIAGSLLFLACAISPLFFHALGKDADHTSLKKALEAAIRPYKATVGIAVTDFNGKEIVTVNDGHHYPMLSVYKFPLAICILNLVDQGKLSLNKVVHVKKEQLHKDTWSPLATKYPDQDIELTLSELLEYTVSKSDNNTCDILFSIAGGTGTADQYMHSLGIENISIKATEAQMHTPDWNVQYSNWSTPSAMLSLLNMFYRGTLLSKSGNSLLMKMMVESENSPNRIKGKLPPGTVVAHKTGTSNTNKKGITAATNDVGIITLPDGRHIGMVVFVSDLSGGPTLGEQIIAEVSKCVWDHYTDKK